MLLAVGKIKYRRRAIVNKRVIGSDKRSYRYRTIFSRLWHGTFFTKLIFIFLNPGLNGMGKR